MAGILANVNMVLRVLKSTTSGSRKGGHKALIEKKGKEEHDVDGEHGK